MNENWESWSNHIILTLKMLEDKMDKFENIINKNNLNTEKEIAVIKTKNHMWSCAIAFIVSISTSIFIALLKFM